MQDILLFVTKKKVKVTKKKDILVFVAIVCNNKNYKKEK